MIILLKNKLEESLYVGYVNSTNHKILTQLVDYVYNNKMQFLISLIDGEIFKTDIYSMGITLYYIFNYLVDTPINLELDKETNKLVSLIYNMTLIDYRSRFNIYKCTNSDYFNI